MVKKRTEGLDTDVLAAYLTMLPTYEAVTALWLRNF